MKRNTVCHVMKLYQKIDEFDIKLPKHEVSEDREMNLSVSISILQRQVMNNRRPPRPKHVLSFSSSQEYVISNIR